MGLREWEDVVGREDLRSLDPGAGALGGGGALDLSGEENFLPSACYLPCALGLGRNRF